MSEMYESIKRGLEQAIAFTNGNNPQFARVRKPQPISIFPNQKIATLCKVPETIQVGSGEIVWSAKSSLDDEDDEDFLSDHLQKIEGYGFDNPRVKLFYKEESPYPIFLGFEDVPPRMKMHVGNQIYPVEPTDELGLFQVTGLTHDQLGEVGTESPSANAIWLERV